MTDYLYGLHVVQSSLERAPHNVLELWLDSKRYDQHIAKIQQLAEAVGITHIRWTNVSWTRC